MTQDLRIVHFKGVINDYSPSTVSEDRGKFGAHGPGRGKIRHSQFYGGPDDGDFRLRDYYPPLRWIPPTPPHGAHTLTMSV
jgi:hypothetical protein